MEKNMQLFLLYCEISNVHPPSQNQHKHKDSDKWQQITGEAIRRQVGKPIKLKYY